MTVEINTSIITKIETTYDSLDELANIENIYFEVLSKLFLHKPVLIITIASEKKYSLGYEMPSFRELKFDKIKYLVNEINSCSSSMLSEISRSEEFSRGLLVLMTHKEILSKNLEEIIKHVHNKIGLENLPYESVQCENDGKSLYMYNIMLSKEELRLIVSNL